MAGAASASNLDPMFVLTGSTFSGNIMNQQNMLYHVYMHAAWPGLTNPTMPAMALLQTKTGARFGAGEAFGCSHYH